MATNQVSGIKTEALATGANANAKVSAEFVKVIATGANASAKIASEFVKVLVSTATASADIDITVDFADDAGFDAEITTTAPQLDITVPFVDDGGFVGTITSHLPGVRPVGHFVDDAGFTGTITTYANYHITIGFRDDLGFAAKITATEKAHFEIPIHYVDENGFTLALTSTPPKPHFNIAIGFTDDTGFAVAGPHLKPNIKITVAFADDAGFLATPNILPVGGPFFFTWADEGAVWNSGVTTAENEDVFSFSITQEEGDFANASVVVRNPRVGLLTAGRKKWAFLSIKRAGIVVPFFYGRLIGIPNNIFEELVTLEFVGRPYDYADRKAVLAQSLRVLPWYDPIFIDPDSWIDDDVVLEARSANWHIDRVTGEVTISDLLTGEDGTLEFDVDEYFDDNLQVTLGDAPLRSVTIQSTMPWDLTATGNFDLTNYVLTKGWGGGYGGYGLVGSFTFDGLSQDWPKTGSSIGDGWEVAFGELSNVAFTTVPEATIPSYFDSSTIPQAIPQGSILFPPVVTDGEYHAGEDAGFNINVEMVVAPIGYGKPILRVGYSASRDMGQFVTFTMVTDVQDVLTLAPDSDNKIVTVNSNKLSDVSQYGDIPIGDSRSRDFVRTARGIMAMRHLMLIARANLVAGTRVVKVVFDTDFFRGLDVTLRKGAIIHNPRLPAGQAAGKITAYTLTLDGDTGASNASITFASAVGKGGAYEASDGDPDYIEDDYIEMGHFTRINEVILAGTNDVAFGLDQWAAFDDGVDFRNLSIDKIVKQFEVQNGPETQRAALITLAGADQATVSASLQLIPTLVSLELIPMTGGPYLGGVAPTVQPLVIPKQIDLEAASND